MTLLPTPDQASTILPGTTHNTPRISATLQVQNPQMARSKSGRQGLLWTLADKEEMGEETAGSAAALPGIGLSNKLVAIPRDDTDRLYKQMAEESEPGKLVLD